MFLDKAGVMGISAIWGSSEGVGGDDLPVDSFGVSEFVGIEDVLLGSGSLC